MKQLCTYAKATHMLHLNFVVLKVVLTTFHFVSAIEVSKQAASKALEESAKEKGIVLIAIILVRILKSCTLTSYDWQQ